MRMRNGDAFATFVASSNITLMQPRCKAIPLWFNLVHTRNNLSSEWKWTFINDKSQNSAFFSCTWIACNSIFWLCLMWCSAIFVDNFGETWIFLNICWRLFKEMSSGFFIHCMFGDYTVCCRSTRQILNTNESIVPSWSIQYPCPKLVNTIPVSQVGQYNTRVPSWSIQYPCPKLVNTIPVSQVGQFNTRVPSWSIQYPCPKLVNTIPVSQVGQYNTRVPSWSIQYPCPKLVSIFHIYAFPCITENVLFRCQAFDLTLRLFGNILP